MKTPREILLNRHRSVEHQLDAVRKNALAAAFPQVTGVAAVSVHDKGPFMRRVASALWRELFLPCRGIWAGLATVWLVILVLNFPGGGKSVQLAGRSTPPDRQVLAILREQKEMLAQFTEPFVPSPAIHTKTPGPRGEIPQTITLV